MTHNILIRCDASVDIGLGHVTRCLVLADDFRSKGHNVCFAMKNFELAIDKVREKGFDISVMHSKEESDYNGWIQKVVDERKIDIFIGDIRDGLPIETIRELKEKKVLTVAIDEPSDYAKECDICFYPPHAKIDKQQYKGEIYQGWEYVILREEFYQEYKKVVNKIPNILVMMGGTDPFRLTLKVAEQLIGLKKNMQISVIISKRHPDYEMIKDIDEKVAIYSDIKDMAKFLTAVDFGIISFGMGAYELVAMQIPAIHICLDEDHWEASKLFETLKFVTRCKKEHIKQICEIDIQKRICSPIISSEVSNTILTMDNYAKKNYEGNQYEI